ncbi:hypothetical protein, partial [Flavobacterium sufflavum]|uniref:hypothetical protein n=1 Tax=Flavobacterium sufflavum TaxID=1921138 RepID=UPI0013E8B793
AGTGSALSWTGLNAGTNYNVVSTGAAPTNCPGSSNSVNIVEVANPVALVLTGSSICASNPGTGTVSSSTSQSGVSYQLRIGTTNVQAPQAGTGAALTWTGLNAGAAYNVVSTGAAPTNCPGSSNSVNITEIANPVALVLTGSSICASAQGTGTVSSSTSQSGVSYQLRIGTTNVQAPKGGTGSALSWTGLNAGTNYNVVSTGAAPTNCPGSSNSVDVATEVCGGPLCTYTQGYYGNDRGKSCAPDPNNPGEFKLYTTQELIARALGSYPGIPGTMVIGSGLNNVKLSNTQADILAIIDKLPGGGGGSYALTGSYFISDPFFPASYLTKKGTLNNTLLAQTITLGLNIGINGALSDFELQAGVLVTADAEGGCGSDIAKTRQCIYDEFGNFVKVINDYHYYEIPSNVITELNGNATVQGLFALANKALGGDLVGVPLETIADVVDKINNAFDGCKIFIGYDVPRCNGDTSSITASVTTAKIAETAGFISYPVPIDGQLLVQCTFGYTSDVTIEVFDSKNQLVYTKAQAKCSNGTVITLDYNFNSEQQQIFYIRLTTSQGSTTHDVISAAK